MKRNKRVFGKKGNTDDVILKSAKEAVRCRLHGIQHMANNFINIQKVSI